MYNSTMLFNFNDDDHTIINLNAVKRIKVFGEILELAYIDHSGLIKLKYADKNILWQDKRRLDEVCRKMCEPHTITDTAKAIFDTTKSKVENKKPSNENKYYKTLMDKEAVFTKEATLNNTKFTLGEIVPIVEVLGNLYVTAGSGLYSLQTLIDNKTIQII